MCKKTTKWTVLMLICIIGISLNAQDLFVDFNAGTLQNGYQAFDNAVHEDISALYEETYAAFGTNVTVAVSVTDSVLDSEFMFMDLTDDLEPTSILTDFIGINKGNQDSLYITISGLPAGNYLWKSYHHYANRQGLIYNMQIDNGSSITKINEIHVSHEFSDEYGNATSYFNADGVNPVIIALTCYWDIDLPIIINGFDLDNLLTNETDINSMSFDGVVSKSTINKDDHSITIKATEGTDLSSLNPIIEISAGASISPASGVARDFTQDVTYTVTSEDGLTTQEWTISATADEDWSMLNVDFNSGSLAPDYDAFNNALHQVIGSLSEETFFALGTDITVSVDVTDGVTNNDFLFTDLADDIENSSILTDFIGINKGNQDSLFITIYGLPEGKYDWKSYHHYSTRQGLIYNMVIDNGSTLTDIKDIHASHELTDEPGIATTTFTADGVNPVVIGLTCRWDMDLPVVISGFDIERYINGIKMREFEIEEGIDSIIVDNKNHTITIQPGEGADITSLTPSIRISAGASIYPESGAVQDFNKKITYTIKSENSLKSQEWTVNTTQSSPVEEDTISNATITSELKIDNVSVFPNPARDIVNIDVSSLTGDISVFVYTISGLKVYVENFVQKEIVQVYGLKQGIYLIEVNNENSKGIFKVLVE